MPLSVIRLAQPNRKPCYKDVYLFIPVTIKNREEIKSLIIYVVILGAKTCIIVKKIVFIPLNIKTQLL